MYYRTTPHFLHGGPICPNENDAKNRMIHYSLLDETPAMALELTDEVWSVLKYILYPVHVSDLQRRDWAEQRNSVLESAVDVYKRNKALPIS